MTRTRRLIAALSIAAALAAPALASASAWQPEYVTFTRTYTFGGPQTAAHYCRDAGYQTTDASEVILTSPTPDTPYGTVQVTCRV